MHDMTHIKGILSMQFNRLGHSDIKVPEICLGTMTFGEQNSQQEAFEQLHYALEQGINFGIPQKCIRFHLSLKPTAPQKNFRTMVCTAWSARSGIFSIENCGASLWGSHIREGETRFGQHISEALDLSLKRLHTDYIDLYQLHWPERNTNFWHIRLCKRTSRGRVRCTGNA